MPCRVARLGWMLPTGASSPLDASPTASDNALMKADLKREALLEKLVDHVLAHGLPGASLRPLAAAAGTSDRMLLYYFTDKATLIGAIVQTGAARMAAALEAATGPERRPVADLSRELHVLVQTADFWPYMKLWLEMVALAAQGDAVCRSVGEAVARGFIDWIAARIDVPQAERLLAAQRLLRDVDASALLIAVGLNDVAAALAP